MIDENWQNYKINLIKALKSFTNLSERAGEELAQLATKSDYNKGSIIFHEGDDPKYVYIVYQGRIKFFNSSSSGRTIIARVSYGPGLAGLASLVLGKPYWFTAQALEEVKALRIRREDFLNFILKNPAVMISILGETEKFLHGIYNRFKASVSYPVEQRVFDCLYNLYEQFGNSLPFSDEEVAGLVGTTRETVVRAMRHLKKEGIVKSSRAKITILDSSRLQKLIKESPVI